MDNITWKVLICQIKTHVTNEYLIGLCARLKLPKRRAAYARKLMMAMFKVRGSFNLKYRQNPFKNAESLLLVKSANNTNHDY